MKKMKVSKLGNVLDLDLTDFSVRVDPKNLEDTLLMAVKYSYGFIDGVKRGKRIFLQNLGQNVIAILYKYIDSQASANPEALHHVYEWYLTGSPKARLFDLDYTVSNIGLSIKSNFKQSDSVKENMTVPFYNKAKIMEAGVPVTIKPRPAGVLRFEVDGDIVYTPNPVTVQNPGGNYVSGSFKRIFDEFMLVYFKQSFLRASELLDRLENPKLFKDNFKEGTKKGRSKGIATGFRYIVNAKIEVE